MRKICQTNRNKYEDSKHEQEQYGVRIGASGFQQHRVPRRNHAPGGRLYPSDPAIRGMWLGQSWFHRKEHFYRALLEGLAYEYTTVLSVMRENYPDISFDEIRVIVEGRAHPVLQQHDPLGRTAFELPRHVEHAPGVRLVPGIAVTAGASAPQLLTSRVGMTNFAL